MAEPREKDRRSRKRSRTRLRVRLWGGEFDMHGFTFDVSSAGMFVETPGLIPLGTRLHFELTLDDGSSFFGEGVVARQRRIPAYARTSLRQGVGLRVVPLSEAARHVRGPSDADATLGHASLRAPEGLADATLGFASLRAPEGLADAGAGSAVSRLELDLSEPSELAHVYLRDMRQGGLVIPCSPAPPLGSEVAFTVHLPPPAGLREGKGTVVRHLPELPGVALELADADELRTQIERLLTRP